MRAETFVSDFAFYFRELHPGYDDLPQSHLHLRSGNGTRKKFPQAILHF